MRSARPLRRLSSSLVICACGCAEAQIHLTEPPVEPGASPMESHAVLLPSPSDDNALLGRVLFAAPDTAHSLADASRPNDCIDKLTPLQVQDVDWLLEDALRLQRGETATNALRTFGLPKDAAQAAYFTYRIQVDRREQRKASTEYAACCASAGTCGFGYVAALVHGTGTYGTATDGGQTRLAVSAGDDGVAKTTPASRRWVHGYVAAVVLPNPGEEPPPLSLLGDLGVLVTTPEEEHLLEPARSEFESKRIEIVTKNDGVGYTIEEGTGAISEDTFATHYHDVTGDSDLDAAKGAQVSGLVIGGIALDVAGLALSFAGLVADQPSTTTSCGGPYCFTSSTTSSNGLPFLAAGLVVAGAGSVLLLAGLQHHGETRISLVDAQRCAIRYNRALLRKLDAQGIVAAAPTETRADTRTVNPKPPGF